MEGQINQERHYDFSDEEYNYDNFSDEEWGNDDEESCKDYIEHMASIGKVCDENDYRDFCARVRGEGNYMDTMRHECQFEMDKKSLIKFVGNLNSRGACKRTEAICVSLDNLSSFIRIIILSNLHVWMRRMRL